MGIQGTRRISRSEAVRMYKNKWMEKLEVNLTNQELAEELESTFDNYDVIDDEYYDKSQE